ncbi:MAG TPA: hypothetical protein VGZ02_05560 [Candidatus Baltobacteraceae bacterium]|jgi:hypothetical protein|nr:hypothetical protein [Candidatus Baltobacteraceae bacterium]
MQAVDAAFGAYRFRRNAELIAKRARECFVRAIAGVQRYGHNVGGSIGENPCGLAEAPFLHVPHDRPARYLAEGTRQMKFREAGGVCDGVQVQSFAGPHLDEPDCLGNGVHYGIDKHGIIVADRFRPRLD